MTGIAAPVGSSKTRSYVGKPATPTTPALVRVRIAIATLIHSIGRDISLVNFDFKLLLWWRSCDLSGNLMHCRITHMKE